MIATERKRNISKRTNACATNLTVSKKNSKIGTASMTIRPPRIATESENEERKGIEKELGRENMSSADRDRGTGKGNRKGTDIYGILKSEQHMMKGISTNKLRRGRRPEIDRSRKKKGKKWLFLIRRTGM